MTAKEVSSILPFSDDTLRRWDKEILEEQFGNENFNSAYLLKVVFRDFWTYQHFGYARKFLSWWMSLALESGLKPLIRFGQGVCRNWQELVNVLRFKYTNAAMERFNGTVAKVIARGHGYRDQRYLFLKLRQQLIKNTTFQSAILR